MPILRYQYITEDRFPIDTYSSISCPSMSWTPLSDLAMSLALLSTWTQSTLIFCKYFNKDMRDSSHCSDCCWHMVQVVIPMNAWTHLLKVYDVDSPCKIKLTVNVYFKHSVTAVTKKIFKKNWLWQCIFRIFVDGLIFYGSSIYKNGPPWTYSSSRISLLIWAGVMYSFPSSVCTTSSFFSWMSLEIISIQFLSDNLWKVWHKSHKSCILPEHVF